MTALLIAGAALILVGAVFFWLNLNTPVQTAIPAIAMPLGAAMVLFGLGGMLL